MSSPDDSRFQPLTWLRNSFLAGVAVVLPFVVTVWLIWMGVTFIDNNVEPLVPARLSFLTDVPGGGVLIAVAARTLVGALAGNLVGRWIVGAADRGIANLPLVRSIYGGAKQVFKQVARARAHSFKGGARRISAPRLFGARLHHQRGYERGRRRYRRGSHRGLRAPSADPTSGFCFTCRAPACGR